MSRHKEAITAEEFARLRKALPAVTSAKLYDTYRISETTWRKLRDGVPVKASTLQRVRAHYAHTSSEAAAEHS